MVTCLFATAADWMNIPIYITAMTPLQTAGMLVVAASGNENINQDLMAQYVGGGGGPSRLSKKIKPYTTAKP